MEMVGQKSILYRSLLGSVVVSGDLIIGTGDPRVIHLYMCSYISSVFVTILQLYLCFGSLVVPVSYVARDYA